MDRPSAAFAALRSAQAAIVLAGLLRTPTLALYRRALRRASAGTLLPQRMAPAEMEVGEIDLAGIPEADPHLRQDTD